MPESFNTTVKVSVLIPLYNSEQWITDTLHSVVSQSHPNLEIIVVNDGSTDGSVAAVRKVSDPRIQLITQPNGGASKARNTALDAATGTYLQFLDADDLLSPNKIEIQLEKLTEVNAPRMVASCRWARFFSHPDEADFSPKQIDKNLWCDSPPLDWLLEAWRVNSMMHPAAWLVPSAVAKKAGSWDETLSLNDDGEYFSRVLLASSGILFCPDAQTYYRSGLPDSLSQQISEDACQSLYRSIDLIASRLLAHRSDKETKQICANTFQLYIYTSYPHRSDLRISAQQRIDELGGSTLAPPGGPKFQVAASLLGWRLAKRIQLLYSRCGLSSRRDPRYPYGREY